MALVGSKLGGPTVSVSQVDDGHRARRRNSSRDGGIALCSWSYVRAVLQPIAKRDVPFEAYGRCHVSIRVTSVCRKSLRLRVARAAPWARQMEAICPSTPSIGSPIWSRRPTTSA